MDAGGQKKTGDKSAKDAEDMSAGGSKSMKEGVRETSEGRGEQSRREEQVSKEKLQVTRTGRLHSELLALPPGKSSCYLVVWIGGLVVRGWSSICPEAPSWTREPLRCPTYYK